MIRVHIWSRKAACMATPDSKELQNVGLKQWFSTLATHQKHLGRFPSTVAKVPPQTSEVRIFPVDANAAARVESHCTKLTGAPLLNSKNSRSSRTLQLPWEKRHKQLPTCRNTVVHLELSWAVLPSVEAHLGAVMC